MEINIQISTNMPRTVFANYEDDFNIAIKSTLSE